MGDTAEATTGVIPAGRGAAAGQLLITRPAPIIKAVDASQPHQRPVKRKILAQEVDPLIAIAGGGGVNLFNSMGNAWTADYLKITGELDVDLRSDIAAQGARKLYMSIS